MHPAKPSKPSTSLSSSSPWPNTPSKPANFSDYAGLSHPPSLSSFSCTTCPVYITIDDSPSGTVPAFLHRPENAAIIGDTAAILLSGAGGGVSGPSGIYLSLGDKLASLQRPVPVLRMDYRYPARNKYCVQDVLAGMKWLGTEYDIHRFVLVGWSFGGAPVFTVAGMDERVVGCATLASQTAETEGIRNVAPRPVLLIHGTGDRTLSHACSERLFRVYGDRGDRTLKLFEGDDHSLRRNAVEAEKLLGEFVLKCAGIGVDGEGRKMLEKKLVRDGEKVDLMRKGGDLKGNESVE